MPLTISAPQLKLDAEMNTTFTKHMTMIAPAGYCLAVWQRISCAFGIVGIKI